MMKTPVFPKAVNIILVAVFAGTFFLIGGCATAPSLQDKEATRQGVRLGEEVRIHYTCRLPSGDLVATNESEVAENPSVPKSRLFVPRGVYEPFVVLAGGIPESVARQREVTPWLNKLKGLDAEIETRIAKGVVGLEPGERQEIEITSEIPEGLTMQERTVEFSRKKKIRFNKFRLTLDEFAERFGGNEVPDVGRVIFPEAGAPLFVTVVAVDDDGVELQPSALDGGVVPGPVGPEVYHSKGDHLFERIPDVRPGDLVRAGPIAGRIVQMTDKKITVDHGHPFAGESFMCEVVAEPVKKMDRLTSNQETGEGEKR